MPRILKRIGGRMSDKLDARRSAEMTEKCREMTWKAIRLVGSQKRVGEICGLTQQSVADWVRSTGRIPFEYLPIISRATNIPPAALRPDYEDILKNHKIRRLAHLELEEA